MKNAMMAAALFTTFTVALGASGWRLTSFEINSSGVQTEGVYSTSNTCEQARKTYLKLNPTRRAICMKEG